MAMEDFKKALEKKPTKREADENRIVYELGQDSLDFALHYEKEISKNPTIYLRDLRSYKSELSEKERIWYRACLQTYYNYFRSHFHESLYAPNTHAKDIVFNRDYKKVVIIYSSAVRRFFTNEEVEFFEKHAEEIIIDAIGNRDMDDPLQQGIVGEIIRDAMDSLVGVIGARRFDPNYRL